MVPAVTSTVVVQFVPLALSCVIVPFGRVMLTTTELLVGTGPAALLFVTFTLSVPVVSTRKDVPTGCAVTARSGAGWIVCWVLAVLLLMSPSFVVVTVAEL